MYDYKAIGWISQKYGFIVFDYATSGWISKNMDSLGMITLCLAGFTEIWLSSCVWLWSVWLNFTERMGVRAVEVTRFVRAGHALGSKTDSSSSGGMGTGYEQPSRCVRWSSGFLGDAGLWNKTSTIYRQCKVTGNWIKNYLGKYVYNIICKWLIYYFENYIFQ